MEPSKFASILDLSIALAPDFDSGVLLWKKRPDRHFVSVQAMDTWNTRFVGMPAFKTVGSGGYLIGTFQGVQMYTHRVIYALYHGVWPTIYIDHKNGVITDNRICNLRSANASENGQNRRISKSSSSGFMGVTWHKRDKMWQSAIRSRGTTIHLGYYQTKDEASAAYIAAKELCHEFNPMVRP